MANNPPTVTALAGSSYSAGTVLTGTQLFSASDPQGSADIDYIKVFDANLTGGAVWRYNGSVIAPGGSGYQFEYANRGLLTYTVGTGSNTFVIEAFDNAGADSNDASFTIAGTSVNNPPTVTALAGSSYSAGTVLTGTQLFSASDPQGSADIDYIKVFDANLTGGAVWRYNGSVIAPGGSGYQFEYANRGLLTYTVGTGSNTFVIEAFDNAGADSNDASFTIAGTSVNNPPTVTALAGSSYSAGTVLTGTQLFSASDPQGSADIDYIKVFDANLTGGAVWRYNGSVIAPGGSGYQFEYANRGLLTYTVGTGSNTFVIEAFDNAGADSNDASFTIAGTSVNNPPTVTALAGSSYSAGTVLTGTQLFSASDPQGSADIDYIKVFDANLTGGAVWRYNGSVIAPGGSGYQFEYANRGLLTYTVGTGSNTFVIEAFDNAGADSNDASFTIAGTSVNNPPTVTALAGSSYSAGTVLTGTQLFSASDPQGSADIDYIKVFDANLTGGAVWRYNGSVIAPGGSGYQFEYANRGLLTYTVGTGSNTFVIEAFDNAGADSNDASFTIGATGTPRLTIGDATAAEGDKLSFRLTLDRAADRDITINYATYAGTASNRDDDYEGTTGSSIVIRAGKTTGKITVQTKEDGRVEPNETMSVRVSSISYGVIARGRGDGTIRNDDRGTGLSKLTSEDWDKASGEPNYLGGTSNPVNEIVQTYWTTAPPDLNDLVQQHSNSFKDAMLDGGGHAVTSGYLYEQLYFDTYKKYHAGLDYDGFKGDVVTSPISGVVKFVGLLDRTDSGRDHNRGIVVHDDRLGLDWIFGHLTVGDMKTGDLVEIGQDLGALLDVPSKGPGDGDHLHVEVHSVWTPGTSFWGASSNMAFVMEKTESPLQAYFDFLSHSGA